MRIAVNGRILAKDKQEGIGWFARTLIENTASANPDTEWLVLYPENRMVKPFSSSNIALRSVANPVARRRRRRRWLVRSGIALPWWVHRSLPAGLQGAAPDVFFSPDGLAPRIQRYPTILTIHDLAPLEMSEYMRLRDRIYYRFYLPRILRQTDGLVTVSEFTRGRISDLLGYPYQHIRVVHNVVRPGFRPLGPEDVREVRQRYTDGKPYFLYVGAIHPRKNLSRLVQTYENFRRHYGQEVNLVIAGAKGWSYSPVMEMAERSPYREDIHFTGYVPEEDLYLLTGGASAAVNLSLYEGFGMPLVEAMACGVPVLCSDRSAFPEITGGAAHLVDPMDTGQIAYGMRAILQDRALRQTLIEKGRAQTGRYHWQGASEVLMECLQKAAGRSVGQE